MIGKLFSREIIKLKSKHPEIKMTLIKTCECEYNTWSKSNKHRFTRICNKADNVYTMFTEEYSKYKRLLKYRFMISRSHTTIIMHDNKTNVTKVKELTLYASFKEKWVVSINPFTREEKLFKTNKSFLAPGNLHFDNKLLSCLSMENVKAYASCICNKKYPVVVNNYKYNDAMHAFRSIYYHKKYDNSVHTMHKILVEIMVKKLLTYPELITLLSSLGGEKWLSACRYHQEEYNTSYIQGIGTDSGFIKALIEAYNIVIDDSMDFGVIVGDNKEIEYYIRGGGENYGLCTKRANKKVHQR